MTFSSALFTATQVVLDLDPDLQAQAWQWSRSFATPLSQWNAYLNQLSLHTVLQWIQTDRTAHPFLSQAARSSLWEVVNGSAIDLSNSRLVIIPSEAVDQDEARIPQEWVEIPDWLGDYYLTVQLDPDDHWLRISGFISHHHLRQRASYDPDDRTYSLDEADLNADLSTLWVAQAGTVQASTQSTVVLDSTITEPTRSIVNPLAPLPLAQAQNLIQRLGDLDILEPRLAIPFATWGALLAHDGWRQQLADRRRGLPEQRSLRQWLQGLSDLTADWRQVRYQASAIGARGQTAAPNTTALARTLTIAGLEYVLQVIPLDLEQNAWRFELRPRTPGSLIPTGFVLQLLTEDLQAFPGNQDSAIAPVEELFIEITLEPGEGIVWQVEPTPADYDREILRF